ncbi:NAD-dependent epimerase/dehydratase family protein [Nonomuraea insulae]|uniref:NAD-dependent epimerase/dehydratase family protein n=1 Tax=Nonomuraea insulae TaxID=1616787 RepID=A0ABW1CK15_9ACTN
MTADRLDGARRYLVTGATGFVGGRLTRALLARGDAVMALARPSPRASALRELGVDVVDGDLVSGKGIHEALRGADRVIHLAAVVKARTAAEFWACNRDGTANLVRALAAQPDPPRLVVCSSLAAGNPVSLYGRSKRAGEDAVREHAGEVPAIILRPGIVYGPGDPALLPALLPMIRLGLAPKAGFGPRRYGLIYVDDLCAALLAAADRGNVLRPGDPTAGVYPLSDGTAHHWRDICAAAARAAGRRAPAVLPVPVPLLAAVAALSGLFSRTVPALNRDKVREMRHADWTCVPDEAVHDLGFTPATSLDEGFKAAFDGDTAGGAVAVPPRLSDTAGGAAVVPPRLSDTVGEAGAVPLSLGDHYLRCLAACAKDDSRMHMAVGAHMPGPPPPPEEMRRLVTDRLRQAPVLRYRLTGRGRHACWAPDPDFDPARHVEYHQLEPGQNVYQAITDVMADRPLPRDRPLWRLWVLHGHTAGEHVLLYTVHHAFQDVLATLSVLRALTGDETLPHPVPMPASRSTVSTASALRRTLADLGRLAAPAPRWHPTQAASSPNPRLVVASLDIEALRDIARHADATIPQITLAVLSGALRAWHPEPWQASSRRSREITVNLAISWRGRRNHAALGNHVGVFPVTLPCAEQSPYERLRRIIEQTTLTKVVSQRRTARALYDIPAAAALPVLRTLLPLGTRGSANRLDAGAIQATQMFPGARDLFVCPPLAPGVAAMFVMLHTDDTASISGIFDTHVARPEQVLDLIRQALTELRADVFSHPQPPPTDPEPGIDPGAAS